MKQGAITRTPVLHPLGRLFRVAIILSSLRFSTAASAVEMEETQPKTSELLPAKDCGQDQYYYTSGKAAAAASCRNCSEIGQILMSANNYQTDWLGGRAVGDLVGGPDIRKPNTEQENNLFSGGGGLPSSRHQPARFTTADGEILSRLISVDPLQDPEYLDSNNPETTSNPGDNNVQSDYSDANDAFVPSDGNEDDDDDGDDKDGDGDTIVGQTRLASIVNRFVHSSFVGNELLGTIEQCRQYQNISACQMWSNMCVMTMYSYSDSPSLSLPPSPPPQPSTQRSTTMLSAAASSSPNRHHHQLKTSGLHRASQEEPSASGNWPQARTWQTCRQFNMNSVCNSLRDWLRLERKSNLGDLLNIYANDIEPSAKVGHSTMRLNQVIQLLAYKYSYDGKFLGVDQFGLEGLESFCILTNHQLSPSSTNKRTTTASNHVRLGKNMRFRCQFDPLRALRSPNRIKHFNETIFMDLFVGYPMNGAVFIKPVPIMIKNLLYNGQQINRKYQSTDSSRLKLVHRFFFHTIMELDQQFPPPADPKPVGANGRVGGGNPVQPMDQGRAGRRRRPPAAAQLDVEPASSSHHVWAGSEQVLIYAKSVLLDLKFRRQDKGALLSSLMLTLDYGQLPLKDYETMITTTQALDTTSTNGSSSSFATNGANNNNNMTPTTPMTSAGSGLVGIRSGQAHNLATLLETKIEILQTLTDMSSYRKDLDLAITILAILSSIWALIRCYNVQKCYGIVKLDLETLIRFLLIGCDIVGNLFAALTLTFMGFLFVSLKFAQSNSIQVLAPSEDLEAHLVLNLQLALLFKLIGLAHKLYVMLNVDLFFIDWEKPKMLTSAELLNHHYQQQQQRQQMHQSSHSNHDHQPVVGSANVAGSAASLIKGSASPTPLQHLQQQQQQSSFWRPYTIINRWLQLQTMRRHNTTLQLLLFVCGVKVSQVINLATSDPSLNTVGPSNAWPNNGQWIEPNHSDQPQQSATHLAPYIGVTFRLLILSSVYLLISVSQIMYKKHFYEPMVRNRIHEFVDLCSVANVSLFSMLYPRFGYYIHGRNANGSGDCGISDMNALLEREERDLCSKRGLAPDSDQQTFVLVLPRIINDHYRKLLFKDYDHLISSSSSLSAAAAATINNDNTQLNKQQPLNVNRLNQANKFLDTSNSLIRSALNLSIAQSSQSFSSNRTFIETIVAKNKAINLFLTNFLEHIYKDIDYSIREPRRFESLLLGVDFDDEMSLIAATNSPVSGANNINRNLGPPSAAAAAAAAPTAASNGLISGGGINMALDQSQSTAATFCKDPTNSFTSLLWLGLEFDLVFVELFSLLILDLWLGQPLVITSSLIWLLHQLFKSLYLACARQNLIAKAMVDEKFLFR